MSCSCLFFLFDLIQFHSGLAIHLPWFFFAYFSHESSTDIVILGKE